MINEKIFTICNIAAALGWLPLVFAPKAAVTRTLIMSGAWSGMLAVVYIIFLIIAIQSGGAMDMGAISGVREIFSTDWGVLTGWVHYLCFDLLVGAWEVTDARKRGIGHGWVIPCLILTFFLGPVGFFLYLVLRRLKSKTRATQLFE